MAMMNEGVLEPVELCAGAASTLGT